VALQIDSAFADVIQDVMNGDDVKRQVLAAVNRQAGGSLGPVGDAATNDVRRIVSAELDAG
jgi:hypothetical protein